MKRFIHLLFCFFIVISLNHLFAGGGGGSGGYVDPPPGMPSCGSQSTPGNTACQAATICEVNGYCGTTSSSWDASYWGSLNSAFCGSIENNAFLSFTADASTISFDAYVYGCDGDEAIQIAVFQADDCGSGSVDMPECVDEMYAQSTPYDIEANNLTPGEDYYIMIDGFAGDVCDYTFEATAGVSLPVSVDQDDVTLCLGESVDITADGGDGTYTWDASPDLNTTTGATVTITPPLAPGTYTYTVNSQSTSNCGTNSSVATTSITVESCGCPVAVSNSGPICLETGDLFDLEADVVSGNMTSFSWDGPNGYTSNDQNPTNITPPTTAGSYDYTFTATIDGVVCSSTTTLEVEECPNGCNLDAIRTAYTDAGCIELTSCTSGCNLYFLNPQSMTGSEAQTFAENLGGNLVSIQSQAENDCILGALTDIGQSGTIWIGLGDEAVEGDFVWYDQSPVNYTNWAPGEPNQSGNEDCVQIYPGGSDPGMWNDLDCDDGDSKSIIEVNLCPQVNAGPDTTICEGGTATMGSTPTILGSAPYTYEWNHNGPTDYPNSVSPSTTTEYILESEDQFGCVGADTMNVEVTPLPTANAGNDITICDGENVVLTGAGSAGTWDNGVTDGVAFTPSTTQTYTYTATSGDCSASDDVTVTVQPRPGVGLMPNDTLGCDTLTVKFTNLVQQAGVDYTIDYGDGTTSSITNDTSHFYSNPGCYNVSITADLNGCLNDTTYSSLICVTERPTASFNANPQATTIVSPEVNFINTSVNATDYVWNFGDDTGQSIENSPSHRYPDLDAGEYIATLIASSGENCTDTARANIKIEGELIYYIPNSFTPDGDEYNPTFKPIFTTGYDVNNYNLLIFNRWGEIVFESNDASIGWDGTYGAESNKIIEGTYIWKIEFKTTRSDERKSLTGHVTLIK